jgi:flagellar biosynthetic protein FliQ
MTSEFVISLGRDAIQLALMVSLPLLGVGLVVGLLVAVFQATTQVQEMTLSFVPKIVAVLLTLLAASSWILQKLTVFTSNLIQDIPKFIG